MGNSSLLDPAGLLERAGLGAGNPPLGGFGAGCSTHRASPLHHHMGMSMSWCVNIAVQLQRETCSSWLSRFLSSLKGHSMDVMVYSTMTASERSAPETCLSFLHSQGSRVQRRAGYTCKRDAQAWGWKLSTGSPGISPTADGICGWLGGQKLPLLGGRWLVTPQMVLKTCSSKPLSTCTKCRKVTFLLQEGHLDFLSARRKMQV